MQSVEQSGRTVDEAVQAALKALGVSRDEVDVEVLAEESRGILGILGYSEAKVRVSVRPGLAQRALDILTRIVELMGIDAEAEITADESEGVHLELHGSRDLGLLIGKQGQTLAALQLLVAMMANRGQPPDKRKRIVLDAEGYRARRERILSGTARSAAERAKRTGRQVTLDSLTPRERRIVHLALADDPGVSTRSEGEDPHRSVIITPRSTQRRT
ncbi:MAG: protein jag [Armatimonadota bacterium]|nr:MAG: protein jag [Armatimonadota bacterium]